MMILEVIVIMRCLSRTSLTYIALAQGSSLEGLKLKWGGM